MLNITSNNPYGIRPSPSRRRAIIDAVNQPSGPQHAAPLRYLSKLLMAIGACVFLVGDKFLEAFARFNFLSAEIIGILSGILLCAAGYAIAPLNPAKQKN